VWHTSVWAIAAAYFSFMQMFFSFNMSEGMIVAVPGQWSLSHNLTDVLEAYDCKSLGLHPNCSVCKVHPELAFWIFTLDKMPGQGSITSLYMFWQVEMLSLCQLPTKKKTVPNSAPWMKFSDVWLVVHAPNLGTHENIWKMYQISRTKAMFVSVNFFLVKA
jgi:hypothetical protein